MKLQRSFYFLLISLSIHFFLAACFYWLGSGENQKPMNVQISVHMSDAMGPSVAQKKRVAHSRKMRKPSSNTMKPHLKESKFRLETSHVKSTPSHHARKASSQGKGGRRSYSGAEESSSQARAAPSLSPVQFQLSVSYPSLSLKAREEGQAMFKLYFSEDQKLSDFELVKSSGYDRLDRAVKKALQAQQVPGETHLEQVLTVRFRLAEATPTLDVR